MPYIPSKLPSVDDDAEPGASALADYLETELQRISSSLLEDIQVIELGKSTTAPLRPRTGILVYVDGTTWNPGAGKGLYIFGMDNLWHLVLAA